MLRIDTHHHVIPPDYRKLLRQGGLLEAGGRALPEWSPEASLQAMADLDVGTAILSVSTPGTAFLPNPADAAALARDLNDYTAEVAAAQPDRYGFFATVPLPHIDESVAEIVRCTRRTACRWRRPAGEQRRHLSGRGRPRRTVRRPRRPLGGGVHPPGRIAGPEGARRRAVRGRLFARHHPGRILLGTQRDLTRYPNIRFILSHAGGFVPYASHRMAIAITGDTGRSWADVLDDFAGFYFDTALSSSAAALPSLLAFAKPGHITFGSDFPYAPTTAGKVVRRRPGDLSRNRHRRPRRHRARQRAGLVPAVRRCAATHFAVAGATRPPHRQPLSATWRRPADEHALANSDRVDRIPGDHAGNPVRDRPLPGRCGVGVAAVERRSRMAGTAGRHGPPARPSLRRTGELAHRAVARTSVRRPPS